jgi:hypothetical protein
MFLDSYSKYTPCTPIYTRPRGLIIHLSYSAISLPLSFYMVARWFLRLRFLSSLTVHDATVVHVTTATTVGGVRDINPPYSAISLPPILLQ